MPQFPAIIHATVPIQCKVVLNLKVITSKTGYSSPLSLSKGSNFLGTGLVGLLLAAAALTDLTAAADVGRLLVDAGFLTGRGAAGQDDVTGLLSGTGKLGNCSTGRAGTAGRTWTAGADGWR
jgi:hypothetical protein